MEMNNHKSDSGKTHPGKALLWLLAMALVVACAVFLGSMELSRDQIFPVYITEVMASNSGYPNAEGRLCDYIELRSGADYPIDLSDFQMGDISGKRRYVFPEGTVIAPGEYLTVYCDKNAPGEGCAPFEINRAGGENFCLIAKNGAVVDSVITLPMDIDQAMILTPEGIWEITANPTPGRPNGDAPAPYGDIYNPQVSAVRISEFSCADSGFLPGLGEACDWVELHNTGAETVDLSGFILSDDVKQDKYIFPAGSRLAPGAYLVVFCADNAASPEAAPFGLSRKNPETLVLKDAGGRIIEIVHTDPGAAFSTALQSDGTWAVTREVSPGYENTPQGHQLCLEDAGAAPGDILISEVMAGEQLLLPDAWGEFSDWVELYNTTDRPVSLDGWYLSDDPAQPDKWMIRNLTLQPGEYRVIRCSGRGTEAAGELHSDFSLAAAGEDLVLTSRLGNVVDAVTFPETPAHHCVTFAQGQAALSGYPTPGYANQEAGFEAFCDSRVPAGSLAIWEVMTANERYLPQVLGQCYDWAELRNVSGEALDLTGFRLTDDADEPGLVFPEGTTLAPGEMLIVIFTTEPQMVLPEYTQAFFGLNAKDETLLLYDSQGKLSDYVRLWDIPLGYSYGRQEERGGFYYMEPSPQNPNGAGCRLISSDVVSSYDSGVYSQEDSFTVTLEAPGQIYYTTDGSEPGSGDNLYTGPLEISKNTALRAVAIEQGKLPSDIYTATFIVGDSHDLPVVSLVTDPQGLWGKNGIYKNGDKRVKEIQLPAHVSYSGPDGSFAINCATNLHGATTVTAFNKKTFAVRFQDRFDGPLHYDVFGDGEVTSFSSLLIRTAHESTFSSQMHDALICHVASYASDKMVSQKFKYVALYLNGEYWGLYALRERHSEEHFASYMNVPAESVQVQRHMIQVRNELYDLYQFCKYRNFARPEHYDYARSVVNMESYVDWVIFEAYMANIDINYNLRLYRNGVDGLWYMGLSDLDLGMTGSHMAFDMVATSFHHGEFVSALMANEDFQDLLARRLAELLEGPLSDENMIATIRQMADTIRTEAQWEAARWGTPVYNWENTVEEMIRFCDGRAGEMIDNLCAVLHLTAQERETYFAHLE